MNGRNFKSTNLLLFLIAPVVFGRIIDTTRRWDYPFVASLGMLLVGALMALMQTRTRDQRHGN